MKVAKIQPLINLEADRHSNALLINFRILRRADRLKKIIKVMIRKIRMRLKIRIKKRKCQNVVSKMNPFNSKKRIWMTSLILSSCSRTPSRQSQTHNWIEIRQIWPASISLEVCPFQRTCKAKREWIKHKRDLEYLCLNRASFIKSRKS